jgi:uncharacterized protein with NRDE domain
MCVASIAWDAHPRWLLVAIGNRDEFHARPTAPLARWADEPGMIAGRDLQGGGTWLGVSDAGRFALVTNYRRPEGPQPGRPTRGQLVTDLLSGRAPQHVAEMNAFNLVHASPKGAGFLTNWPEEVACPLGAGIHGLSNGGFETPWPKTHALNAALKRWLADGTDNPDPLFSAMADSTALGGDFASEHQSAVFIRDPVYGTRCSTVVLVERDGTGCIIERSFDAGGSPAGAIAIRFAWPV